MRLNLYLIRETEGKEEGAGALLLTDEPKSGGREWWVPRSLISYLKKDAALSSGRRPVLLDLPEWKLKQMGLC